MIAMAERVAVIADVHGNDLALAAVRDDIAHVGVDATVCLGDMASGPLNAARTCDMLMDMDLAASVRGNHDRWLTVDRDEMTQLDDDADAELTDRHRAWLTSLPATAQLDEVFLCHGSPTSDMVYWLERPGVDGWATLVAPEEIRRRAGGVWAPVMLCGHTHVPRIVRLDGTLIVNPGALGLPAWYDLEPEPHGVATGTPDASYAVLERRGGRWSASLRYVPYDNGAMAKLASGRGRENWAHALATGWPVIPTS